MTDPFHDLLLRLTQQYGRHEGERRFHAQISKRCPDVQSWMKLGKRSAA